jgi:adenylate kinase family enzyme
MIQQMVMESLVTANLLDYRGTLFNGFPRTRKQAANISAGMKTDLVVYLDISDQLSIQRQLGRGDESTDPRPEDLDEVARKKRLVDYHAKTEPILEYYRETVVPIVEIDGSLSISQVTQAILAALKDCI